MNKSESNPFERSHCPVANTLDLFGDKWSLLIVRDLLLGKIRYGEFAQSIEAIPSNILATRLKRLETAEVITKKIYSAKPVRYQYELTEKGRDLIPVMDAMSEWALKHIPGVEFFQHYREKESS